MLLCSGSSAFDIWSLFTHSTYYFALKDSNFFSLLFFSLDIIILAAYINYYRSYHRCVYFYLRISSSTWRIFTTIYFVLLYSIIYSSLIIIGSLRIHKYLIAAGNSLDLKKTMTTKSLFAAIKAVRRRHFQDHPR